MAISVVSFSFSRAAQPEAQRPTLMGAGFLYHILSPASLVPNSSPPSYIIVQSPTQSLEWHVWSSSSGNNCHAVQRSLSSGASVYECIVGFYLVPFSQPNPPTRLLSIIGHSNVSLPFGASLWNGMFSQVEGQYTTLEALRNVECFFIAIAPSSNLTWSSSTWLGPIYWSKEQTVCKQITDVKLWLI